MPGKENHPVWQTSLKVLLEPDSESLSNRLGNAARLYAIVLLDEMLTLHVGQDAALLLQHARMHARTSLLISFIFSSRPSSSRLGLHTDVLLSPTSANALRNTINMTSRLENPHRITQINEEWETSSWIGSEEISQQSSPPKVRYVSWNKFVQWTALLSFHMRHKRDSSETNHSVKNKSEQITCKSKTRKAQLLTSAVAGWTKCSDTVEPCGTVAKCWSWTFLSTRSNAQVNQIFKINDWWLAVLMESLILCRLSEYVVNPVFQLFRRAASTDTVAVSAWRISRCRSDIFFFCKTASFTSDRFPWIASAGF